MTAPGFWQNETGSDLRRVVTDYIQGKELDAADILVMREYLRQWIFTGDFFGAGIEALRWNVLCIVTMADLKAWLELAFDEGVDPL